MVVGVPSPGPMSSPVGPWYMCQCSGVATWTTSCTASSSVTRAKARATATSSPKSGVQRRGSSSAPSDPLAPSVPSASGASSRLPGKPAQTDSGPAPRVTSFSLKNRHWLVLHTCPVISAVTAAGSTPAAPGAAA